MYNKLFTKILDSSIWLASDPVRLVWITMLAAMDEDGNVMFACADNLALRARVTLEQAENAITLFENPDPKSGDPENEGRRIERIPGGWHILNAHKYRAAVTKAIHREQTRLRTAEWRKRKRDASVTRCDDPVTPSEAVSVSYIRGRKAAAPPSEFEDLKAAYPRRAGDQGWSKALKVCSARIKEGSTWNEMLEGAKRYARYVEATGKSGTEFVKQSATFFGPDKHYLLAWDLPAVPQSPRSFLAQKTGSGIDQNVIKAALDIGFENPRLHETEDGYRTRIMLAGKEKEFHARLMQVIKS